MGTVLSPSLSRNYCAKGPPPPRIAFWAEWIAAHAGAIVGWTIPEGRMFLRDLTEHATTPAFVYSHSWQPHDLVMWDNRATMHRARRFDRTEVRDVRRTTLAGDMGTIEQAA